MPFTHKQDIVGIFAQHKVAANLLMTIMLLAGVWGLAKLNAQFFPGFEIELVTVRVVWQGGTTEDVERSIVVPLEQVLRTVDGLDKMTSTSSENMALISLEFPEGTNMSDAVDRVEDKVVTVRNLPADAERPEVTHAIRYEPIARLLVHGPADVRELRPLVRQFERELLDRGISNINVNGLPEQELAVQVPMARLQQLGLSLEQIANRINAESQDLPAGTVGRDDVGRQIRALNQGYEVADFESIPLVADDAGRLIRLADIADIEKRPRPNQVDMTFKGAPAIELELNRAPSADSLKSARIMEDWLQERRPTLPPGVEITIYDESWQLIKDRINLLLKNGLGGLVLVVAILFLFLNVRVAGWVTLGIPISFMATLAILYMLGGSINMISLFGLIMALGIIVDDAIVVGEDALTHYQTGEDPLQASEGGARRMLAPVLSSSLTTVAAFIPLLSISGLIGKILFDIPLVVICVIFASLVECFLILPGHLRHSFINMPKLEVSHWRQRWDKAFFHFRDQQFRHLVTKAVDHHWTTVAIAISSLILVVGLVLGGRLGFTFFPNVEGNVIVASANFVTGTPPERVKKFIDEVEAALYQADQELGGGLIRAAAVSNGLGFFSNARQGQRGEQFASVTAELIPSDHRQVRNEEILKVWSKYYQEPPGLENMTLTSRRGGYPGRDLEVRLSGVSADRLKRASQDLIGILNAIPGVHGVEDDMPFGQQQYIYQLTPLGQAMGLTVSEVAKQLRGIFDGQLAQIFNEGEEEVEVRVMLTDAERHHLAVLDTINLVLPNGNSLPLSSALDLKPNRGFKVLRHTDGKLAVNIYADVDRQLNNANRIRGQLGASTLPDLVERYGLDWKFTGRAEDQTKTLGDMKQGALFAAAMIYIVLAWVFSSYGWPLVVMVIIPFGLVGAVVGHWVMGIELTLLSMFGIFGLSGILVNDSIILVVFYKGLRKKGVQMREAIIEAACQRLRAVLLTSLTTIAGLTPLLFETSLQAQFLIPMAVSISFGLAFATFLVLFLIPALLSMHERLHMAFSSEPAHDQAISQA